jgi:membrane-bound ClpP family serine protease
MKRTIKDWLIILASLLDDLAVALLVLLVLWLLKIPISLPIIIFLALLFVATVFIMHKAVIPALHRRKATGSEGMIGLKGKVTEPLTPAGTVRVGDEYWKAKSVGENVAVGEEIEIIGLEGLTLRVSRKR